MMEGPDGTRSRGFSWELQLRELPPLLRYHWETPSDKQSRICWRASHDCRPSLTGRRAMRQSIDANSRQPSMRLVTPSHLGFRMAQVSAYCPSPTALGHS